MPILNLLRNIFATYPLQLFLNLSTDECKGCTLGWIHTAIVQGGLLSVQFKSKRKALDRHQSLSKAYDFFNQIKNRFSWHWSKLTLSNTGADNRSFFPYIAANRPAKVSFEGHSPPLNFILGDLCREWIWNVQYKIWWWKEARAVNSAPVNKNLMRQREGKDKGEKEAVWRTLNNLFSFFLLMLNITTLSQRITSENTGAALTRRVCTVFPLARYFGLRHSDAQFDKLS